MGKRKNFIMAALLLSVLLSPVKIYGTQVQDTQDSQEEQQARQYLALGENLKEDEKNTVLELMGIAPGDLDSFDVVYVTNEEEHQYLDAYIPKEKIGTRALSSVKITLLKEGEGLSVSTTNINYCTVGMYKNALITAGVKDADIQVVGPFELSGTAALIGTFEAYEKLTGNELNEAVVDAAMNELVLTGELEENLGEDKELLEALIADVKGAIARGELTSYEEIKEAIGKLAKEYKLDLSEKDQERLTELMNKIKDLDIDWKEVAKQTVKIANQVKDVMEESGLLDLLKEFFRKLLELILSWLK